MAEATRLMKITERVCEIRKKTGLSQVDFAKLLGIPRRTLEKWETITDPLKPSIYVLNWLELTVDYIIKSNYSEEVVNILKKRSKSS